MAIRVLVADDEPLARSELIYLVTQSWDVEVVGQASNGEEALSLIKKLQPHAVFLDISMPKMNGLEVAAELLREDNTPMIIFASAYDRHAIKAFEVNAVDYILKPFEVARVSKTIQRIKNEVDRSDYQNLRGVISTLIREEVFPKNKLSKIAVQDQERFIFLDPEDIFYIFREGREVYIKTDEQKYISKFSLQLLEKKLINYPFYRVHRAFLVNLNHIEQMVPWFNGSYTLIMKDKNRSEVPVSRLFVKELKEILGFI